MADFVIKPFVKPAEQRRSFSPTAGLMKWYTPKAVVSRSKQWGGAPKNEKPRVTQWTPKLRADAAFIERCKVLFCRIPHPTRVGPRMETEYRVHTLPWGNGSYIDLREYYKGQGTKKGMLIHLDVARVLLPEMLEAVQQMERDDQREPYQKCNPQVFRA